MSALDKVPSNINFLSPLGFSFFVKKLPHVNFYVQDFELPTITLEPTFQPNPLVKIPIHGDHIDYPAITVTFKLDEDMQSYRELYTWFKGLGTPEDVAAYKTLAEKPKMSAEGIVSDITLIVLTNIKNPNIEFTFYDAFPIQLSGIRFSTTRDDVQYLDCSVQFGYTWFDVSVIPKG